MVLRINAYNIIIYHGVGAPLYCREVVGGLNYTDKKFLTMIIITVQLHVSAYYDSQMVMNTSTTNTDISLAREFQKHLSEPTRSHGLLDHGKDI